MENTKVASEDQKKTQRDSISDSSWVMSPVRIAICSYFHMHKTPNVNKPPGLAEAQSFEDTAGLNGPPSTTIKRRVQVAAAQQGNA